MHDAFWYFDREMAEATEARYAEERGKEQLYLSVEQQGRLVGYDAKRHVKANPRFQPDADGVTFHLKPVFTDSLRQSEVYPKVKGHPYIERICGPVKVVDDTTFTVDFYRMGTDNPRRTADVCLVACYDGDERYKSAVQELTIRIPYPLKEGKMRRTQHNKIFVASPRTIDLAEFYEQLQALEAAAAHNDEGVVRQLAAMIPTFTPTRENLKL